MEDNLKRFRYFPLLPEDTQRDILRAAMQIPRVHFLEIYGLDRNQDWDEASYILKTIKTRMPREKTPPVIQETVPSGHIGLWWDIKRQATGFRQGRPRGPPVKIAFPQVYATNELSAGCFDNKPLLAEINWLAYETVKTEARSRATKQAPQIHVDLSGNRPTIPLSFNTEQDLVYLHQLHTFPNVWRSMREALEDVQTSDAAWESITSQTKNIRHVMFASHKSNLDRYCLGCRKLRKQILQLVRFTEKRHQGRQKSKLNRCRISCDKLRQQFQQLVSFTEERHQNRQARALRRTRPSCKMCRKIQEQVELGGDPGGEATVRERLLKERMLAMIPEVQRDLVAEDYDLESILSAVPASGAHGHDDDDSDTVSICSNDIDPDDDFAWYSNSREFLVIDTIPYPFRGATSMPKYYVEMPEDSVTGPRPPTNRSSDSTNSTDGNTTTPPTIPTLTRAHFHNGDSDYSFGLRGPKHGMHRQCNITRFVSRVEPDLPRYFPDLESLYLVDYDLTLRPDITELPTQGRRWLTGSPDTLFVEVMDPADGTWVSDDEVRPAWEATWGCGKRQRDGTLGEPTVAEYVMWLRQYWKRFLPRKLEVGLVAYLVLDGDGKVSFKRRPKRQIWKPCC